ncbi:MAG: DUF4837 family protein [Bacteroidales bacterium]
MRHAMLFLLPALVFIASCGDSSVTRTLPNVTGKTGDVLVVIDKQLWEGSPGQAIREHVSPMLISLPQAEPAFTLMPVNPEGFRDIYVAHRNVIQVNIEPGKAKAEMIMERNKWSETQLVVTVAAPDTASLAQCIRDNGEAIRRGINDAERERLTYWLTNSAGRERSVLAFGDAQWELVLPAGWKPDFNREGILMISAETPATTQTVMVSVTDRATSRLGCIELADLTQKRMSDEVKGPDGGSFMVIEQKVPVSCRSFRRSATDYIEMRGLWTLEGGFMGGPFISYAFIDSATTRAVVVTGFVYAPREEKRELLRQVEALMYTVKKRTE